MLLSGSYKKLNCFFLCFLLISADQRSTKKQASARRKPEAAIESQVSQDCPETPKQTKKQGVALKKVHSISIS